MRRDYLIAVALASALTGCDQVSDAVGIYKYRAEVGYYENDKEVWFVGEDKSRDACVSEAITRYNSINAASPRRAFSWACRKMQGERFLDRVR
jgi:hypothetical protein